jgi:hypothetical protein
MQKMMKSLLVLAALAAAALGGSALADAAGNLGSSATPSASAAAPPQGPPGGRPGPRVDANGKQEKPLTGDSAAKVKAAALDKYPGATIERLETDVDHGSPYEAHLTTSAGKQLEVLVNKDFDVTAANEMQHP